MSGLLDVREAILQRLFDLLGEISGIVTVVRDAGDLPSDDEGKPMLPAAILLDGSEEPGPTEIVRQKTVKMPPALFVLKPQIFILAYPRDDLTNKTVKGVAAPIGPELSDWRMKIIATVINDPTLIQLLYPHGQIVFRGSATDMQSGSTMVGQLQMNFDFHYLLIPPTG